MALYYDKDGYISSVSFIWIQFFLVLSLS